jgi:hypothetical protein
VEDVLIMATTSSKLILFLILKCSLSTFLPIHPVFPSCNKGKKRNRNCPSSQRSLVNVNNDRRSAYLKLIYFILFREKKEFQVSGF